MTLGSIFLSETVGTAVLLLLGGGVVANNILPKNKGNGTGFLMVNWGWGIAVLAGAITAAHSGAHINPAVTLGLMAHDLATGTAVHYDQVAVYICGQMLGAFIGAVLCWLTYRKQFDMADDPALKLGVFSTGPEDRDYFWNTLTEAVATFVLLFVIIAAGLLGSPENPTVNLGWLNYLGVALLVVGIGTSLGGPTGYAINPARDLGPRIAHAILPIKGKGSSDWAYSWVPVVGPIIGGMLAGFLAPLLLAG
ncbi:aquaporin family protein [Actinomycetaceae bacterium TAE3-ERU4]|nr:aquaporin family protein [Actinomycetaceae bacterium TAE3-ERU4]